MRTITTTEDLAEYCTQAAKFPYVTVDTEFLRERTYYAKLCLVQLAMPGDDDSNAVLVDPLAKGLSLAPLYDLFRDENVVKVFHAARQDLEIFFVEEGVIPSPLFDTQVAAMVCGFGDQVGYETLVRKIAREAVDKSSRFTDWSRRPLSDAQKNYALADVTHLRVVYEYLAKELEKSKRTKWVTEELGVLTEPSTYIVEPANAWKRVKTRTNSGKFMAAVAALAAFRETYAQSRNVPRNRVFKDDALVELASTKPKDMNDLNRSRLLLREARRGDIAEGILTAIVRAENVPADQIPRPEKGRDKPMVPAALADLLRVLLKAKSEEYAVAQKLICNASDLDGLASGERDLPLLKGWRGEVFGDAAIQLCEGKIALVANGKTVSTVKL